ncbi:MAG: hypothetical protein ACLPYS_03405 [Vulcanimicrobiaceae bacterium]
MVVGGLVGAFAGAAVWPPAWKEALGDARHEIDATAVRLSAAT